VSCVFFNVPKLYSCQSQRLRGLKHFLSPLNTRVVGSNPTWGMDVCAWLFCVCVALWVCRQLVTDCFSLQGVLPTVNRTKKLKKSLQGPTKGCRCITIIVIIIIIIIIIPLFLYCFYANYIFLFFSNDSRTLLTMKLSYGYFYRLLVTSFLS
jgi:hypothetical protein